MKIPIVAFCVLLLWALTRAQTCNGGRYVARKTGDADLSVQFSWDTGTFLAVDLPQVNNFATNALSIPFPFQWAGGCGILIRVMLMPPGSLRICLVPSVKLLPVTVLNTIIWNALWPRILFLTSTSSSALPRLTSR